MALDETFLTGIGVTDEQRAAILKEHEVSETGLKANKEALLAENKGYKTQMEKAAQEREAEKAGYEKKIQEIEERLKASGSDEIKAYYEAELKKSGEKHAAKMAEIEKNAATYKAAADEAGNSYHSLLKDIELEKSMDKISNLDPSMKQILRDTFWARNKFELTSTGESENKFLNNEFRSISDVLCTFIATDEGKKFLVFNSSGGGAPGSTAPKPTVGNPWKKETLNLMDQARITKENPTLAASLKAQAQAGT